MEQRSGGRIEPRELEPVEIQIMGHGFLDILKAKDIGKEGISVHVPMNYSSANVRHEVSLIICIPGYKCFEASGVVIHTGKVDAEKDCRSLGIRFTRISDQHRELLDDYFKNRSAENRQHVRVEPAAGSPILISSELEGLQELQLKDIGVGGMGLEIKGGEIQGCNPDQDLDFIITLPLGDQLTVKGGVRYVDAGGSVLGLCFRSLSSQDKVKLKQYVAKRIHELQEKIESPVE